MALSADSKIKQIMKNPEAVAVLEEYFPGFSANPQMKMVAGLPFRKLALTPEAREWGFDETKLDEVDAKLKAIEE